MPVGCFLGRCFLKAREKDELEATPCHYGELESILLGEPRRSGRQCLRITHLVQGISKGCFFLPILKVYPFEREKTQVSSLLIKSWATKKPHEGCRWGL